MRRVPVPWIVAVPWRMAVEEELAAAGCAHAVRGAGGAVGVGIGGSYSGSLHEQGCAELSHRAAQLEEDQHGPTGLFGLHGFGSPLLPVFLLLLLL